ncbi:MAG: hypothetical protein AB8E15_03390 [Bdellovibrionales bacterium]
MIQIIKDNHITEFFKIHIVLSIVIGAILSFVKPGTSLISFSAGTMFMLLNVALLIVTLSGMLNKNSVALPIGVIVFKYAILGIFIFMVVEYELLEIADFMIGIGVLLVSAVVFALVYNRLQSNSERED